MKPFYINQMRLEATPFGVGEIAQGQVTRNAFAGEPGKASFQDVLMDTLGQVNGVMNQPDTMLQEAVTNGTYDVHDVMLASAKAELAVTITSQIATKVVQAYDRILQIQI